MKIFKRVLLVVLALVVLLLAAAVSIPFLFKDEILTFTKAEINKNVRAEVNFDQLNLSLLRSFPDLQMELTGLDVVGIDTFAGVPLIKADRIAFSLDLMSVLKGGGAVKVNEVQLDAPDINILVLSDGLANYDIALPTTEPAAPDTIETDYSGLSFQLRSYGITDGRLVYDDQSSDTYAAVYGLNHQGDGNFTLDEFDLNTSTSIDSLTARQGGIGYLTDVKTTLEAVFLVNLPENKYTLKDNTLTLNALTLKADGFVQLLEDDAIGLDLRFAAPGSDFRELWSLIPNAYTAGYEQVKISGNFSLNGEVKGTYREEAYPSFKLAASVDNGNVKYPDLPLGISDISTQLAINSPGADLDQMVIDVSKLKLRVGSDPFEARIRLQTPLSDPDLDMSVKGIIDLAQWARAFPIPDVQALAGRIDADVDINTRMSTIDRGAYDQVKMSGQLAASGIKYQGTGLPAISISRAAATFTPQRVNLSELDMQLGRSDMRANGYINNLLAYFSPEKTMTGQLTLRSNLFEADEWLEEETPASTLPAAPAVVSAKEAEAVAAAEIFDRFDFAIDAEVGEIRYDTYVLKDTRAQGRITPNRMELNDMSTLIGDSDLRGSGLLLNAFKYTFADGVLGGEFDVKSNFLNLNQFMEESPATATGASTTATTSTTAMEPIPVPANISMTINAQANKVQYTNLELTDFSGRLLVKDQQVLIEDGTTKVLGGAVDFAGAYDTQDEANPYFNFRYDLRSMDFQKAFNAFNTFQALMPAGKFIQGNFSTSLVMEGLLGQDMMPKLATLNADGFLETLNSTLNGFKPLAAIGNSLDIDELKESVQLNNLKSWFSVRNGAIEVKPFDLNIKNIGMNISGTHGLNQQMAYAIKTRVPRSALGNSAAGQAVNQGVNQLLSQAANLGVNVSQSEYLNVLINVTGSLTDPKVGFKLLGGDGETSVAQTAQNALRDEVNQQTDQVRQQLQQQVTDTRDRLENQANQALDSAKVIANQRAAELQRQAEQAARDRLGGVVDSATLKQGQQTVDQIKDNLQQ